MAFDLLYSYVSGYQAVIFLNGPMQRLWLRRKTLLLGETALRSRCFDTQILLRQTISFHQKRPENIAEQQIRSIENTVILRVQLPHKKRVIATTSRVTRSILLVVVFEITNSHCGRNGHRQMTDVSRAVCKLSYNS
ncbi:hypothetical protein N7G274_003009 [Stereocaulon virgatum]|uniref:Uncharacterized protein n=1 Tax=Stereocaulon virgatum TaxID=373712 RepID=A0ABR4AFP1_9LECA